MDPFQSPRGATWDGRRPSGSLLFRFLVARALVTARSRGLLANAELGDHGPVTIRIVRLQVIQQSTALAHQHQQTAPRSVILRVRLEVLSQIANALAENRYLHLGAAGIGVMGAEAGDNFGFLFGCQHVCAYSSDFCDLHFLSVCIKSNMPAPRMPPGAATIPQFQ